MRFDPASAPGPHRPIGGSDAQRNLLIALLRMFARRENDARPHRQRLRCMVGADEMLKEGGFFSRQRNGVTGFRATHG